MYKIIYLVIFIFLSSSLEAYSKKIILASFSTPKKANSMLEKLPKQSPYLYKLSKEYVFDFKVKKSGKYYIVLAEFFQDKEVLKIVLKKFKEKFRGAYVVNGDAPKIETKKEEPIVKELKVKEKEKVTVLNVLPISPPITIAPIEENKSTEIKAKVLIKDSQHSLDENPQNNTVEEISTFIQKYFEWYYLVILFFLSLFIYYYLKFKRIYDSY